MFGDNMKKADSIESAFFIVDETNSYLVMPNLAFTSLVQSTALSPT